MISFSKSAFADPSLEVNQDRITSSVWLTRGSVAGLFNAASESQYLGTLSPADTEWAWDLAGFNSGLDISAANYEALDFNPWVVANGGTSGGPPSTVDIAGVLHLISEDIYIDIRFTSWGSGRLPSPSGGTFSYQRSTVIPEPDCALLLGLGLIGLAAGRRGAGSHRSKNR